MGSLIIAAVPTRDDPVWKVSTEKKPHVTLLYLGDSNNPDRDRIAQFMIHAANLSLKRFTLDVDRRGLLGKDDADVLFFEDMWDLPELKEFRALLLKDDTIKKAYDASDQFPMWTPHLTLGYPKAPAKDDAVDHPIRYIEFDIIALWDGDYEGVELILKRQRYAEEVSMSSLPAHVENAEQVCEDILSHYGVKGMRWGIRKEIAARRSSEVSVDLKDKRKKSSRKIKTKGGKNLPAHSDAIEAQMAKQVIKKSGTAALSNDDLRVLATRMNLEQQVSNLSAQQTGGGRKLVTKILKDTGESQAKRIANAKATEAVDKTILKPKKKDDDGK